MVEFLLQVLEQGYLQTPCDFNQISKVPISKNKTAKDVFQPAYSQAFPQANDTSIDGVSFDNFNPSFASFNKSPKLTTQEIINGGFQPMGDNTDFIINKQFKVGPTTLGSPSKMATDNLDLFGSFNPFSTKEHVMARSQASQAQQQQPPHTNPFLSTTSASAFWDDPLITSLVDLTMSRGTHTDSWLLSIVFNWLMACWILC